MYFFIEKYKISHQMVTFPWKELPDFHIFSHHGTQWKRKVKLPSYLV